MTEKRIVPLDDAIDELKREVEAALTEGRLPLPIRIGENGRVQAVIVDSALMEELLTHLDNLEIESLVRDRTAAGKSKPLDQLAEKLGLPKSEYR